MRRVPPESLIVAATLLLAAGIPARSLGAQAAPAPAAGGTSPASPAVGPASLLLESGEGKAVAAKLADDLVSQFVYRDQAEAYAAMLKQNAAVGRYDSGTRGELAKRLTDDLQAVHKDGHLHVMMAPQVFLSVFHGKRCTIRNVMCI